MSSLKYQLSSNSWGADEHAAINRVLDSGNLTMGQEVASFEVSLAKFHSVKHAIMVNSGSSANLVATTALTFSREFPNINKCRRGTVIAPAVSWSTTYFPLLQLGYSILLIDVDDTFNLDTNLVKTALAEHDISGIISVNLLGVPADNTAIREICDSHRLFFIEDNCESFGASLRDNLCGSFGDAGTLSFFYSHHLQTMEGGAILTNCDDIARYARSIRAHGWIRDGDYPEFFTNSQYDEFDRLFKFILPGYCVRPIEFSGAAGKVQLLKWPVQYNYRLSNYEHFITHAAQRKYLTTQSSRGTPSWFGFGCLFDICRDERLDLWRHLKSKNIESRPIVAGNFFRQPVTKYCNIKAFGELKVADRIDGSGMFFGNDGIDLRDQIDHLFNTLDAYHS